MLNTYLTTVMVVLSLVALAGQVWIKSYKSKSKLTMVALPILSVLAIVQAIIAKIPRVSIAWWLLLVILIVLMVSTCMSYSAWKKNGKQLAEKVNEIFAEQEAKEASEEDEEEKPQEEAVKE